MNIKTNVLKIPGIEISLDYDRGTFHLVGLFVDYRNDSLVKGMKQLQVYRKERNEKIINMISDMIGKKVSAEDISDENKGELGRPHMAKFLVREGVVSDVQEAFDKYLAKGKPLYLPKKRYDFKTAVKMIHDSGGISILAHPDSLNLTYKELDEFVLLLETSGLDGIEAYCSNYKPNQIGEILQLCEKYNLLISAGSDFHGENKKDIVIGEYLNPPRNSEEILENLLKYKNMIG
jgi:predicted metal-dependent phosphoesterase TrpH